MSSRKRRRGNTRRERVRRPSPGHGHEHDVHGIIQAGTTRGIWALKLGAAGLLATAAVQLTVVAIGRSSALFADALHNLGDVLTTLGLWVAFAATRRAADRRYTFGYQRFEDLAGLGIVVAIFVSAGLATYEATTHLARGIVPTHLTAGMAAAIVGVIGNEAVAQLKIRTGRRIESPALIAEGQHSRIDGLTSGAALVGIVGVFYGVTWADPAAAFLIVAVMLYLGVQSTRPIVAKLADRIDPAIVDRVAREAAAVDAVQEVHSIRVRWAGRALYVVLHISLSEAMTLSQAHEHGEQVRHRILHALGQVVEVDVHLDPFGRDRAGYHRPTEHHFPDPPADS